MLSKQEFIDALATKAAYNKLENEKKKKYGERVLDVEKGTFTPFVFSTLGGCGTEASRFLKRLSKLISTKQNCDLSTTSNFV
jgi:hypothetical protein